VLCRFEGLSHAEIAERLGISRSTVVSHVMNALAALEREMDPGEN
jgi:RNA polymerase sigma-70 factor (ECF subfamily)